MALSLTQTRGVQWLDDSGQRTEQEVCVQLHHNWRNYRHLSEGAETTWIVGPCAYIWARDLKNNDDLPAICRNMHKVGFTKTQILTLQLYSTTR